LLKNGFAAIMRNFTITQNSSRQVGTKSQRKTQNYRLFFIANMLATRIFDIFFDSNKKALQFWF